MKRILSLLVSLFFLSQMNAQAPNDCVNAITVCGNGTFQSNATGIGNTQEVSGCGGMENNSIWLKINIEQSGTLGFDLIPNDTDLAVNYDFWVYSPNANCGTLGSPIRCCTSNPIQSTSSNNHTGMFASTTQTQSNFNQAPYVKWLNVTAGQFYYIAIDRPVGDGGFELQWTGTATFITPPTANAIPDYVMCNSTPDIDIFDLNSLRTPINSNTTDNTVDFFTTLANAVDNVSALPDTYSNVSNPQTIYARVTNNTTGCYVITEFDLVVSTLPTVTFTTDNTTICDGNIVNFTFTGSPNAVVDYTVNNGSTQSVTLDATGNYILSETPSVDSNYQLTLVKIVDGSGNTVCSNVANQSINITVNPAATATISGTTSICSGNTTTITFTGTPDAVVTYTIDGGTAQTITLDNTGNASLTTGLLNASTTYELISATSSISPFCSQLQSGTAVITVNPTPTVVISGTTTICSGDTAIVSFTGTPNAIVSYNVDGGSPQTITLDTVGNASITTGALTTTTVYNLENVSTGGTPGCSQNITGNATITVNSILTATLSGTTTICLGDAATLNFSGTPNAIVTYTIDAGIPQTITLDNTGNATFNTAALITTTTYELVSVAINGTPGCSQNITGSAIVTVNPLPNVTLSTSTTSVCENDTVNLTFTGTPNATVSYTLNSGTTQTITLDVTGNSILTSPALTTTTVFVLTSVSSNETPNCIQALTQNITITVTPKPTVVANPANPTICSGDSSNITLTSPLPNTTFSWTAVSSGVTGATNGTGTTINQVLSTSGLTSGNVVYTITPSSNGCIGTPYDLTVLVNPKPVVTANPTNLSICSGENAIITLSSTLVGTTFSWTVNATNVTGATNGTGTSITQTLSASGTASGTVIYTITPDNNGCQGIPVTAIVNVSPQPNVTATVNQASICSGESALINLNSPTIGTTFSWTVAQTDVSGASSGSGTSINQILTATSANQGSVTYTITPNNNGCIGTPITETITVNPAPTALFSGNTDICSGDAINLVLSASLAGSTFEWTVVSNGILGASNGSGTSINDILINTSSTVISVIYTVTPTISGCDGIPLNITVNVYPEADFAIKDGVICINPITSTLIQSYILNTGLNQGEYVFEWFLENVVIPNATNSFYEATQTGMYSVIATSIVSGCTFTQSAIVTESYPGQLLTITQSQGFNEKQIVTVTVDSGTGNYLYQLDYGPFQESNIFIDVTLGEHTITVTDANGCTLLTETIWVIGFPKYFTPNADGYNDTWNIITEANFPAQIQIFDRYGKFITELKSGNNGWDGTYNGQILPATDYWFVINYLQNGLAKTFRSHFSLKR